MLLREREVAVKQGKMLQLQPTGSPAAHTATVGPTRDSSAGGSGDLSASSAVANLLVRTLENSNTVYA